jgi:hypothetical protein
MAYGRRIRRVIFHNPMRWLSPLHRINRGGYGRWANRPVFLHQVLSNWGSDSFPLSGHFAPSCSGPSRGQRCRGVEVPGCYVAPLPLPPHPALARVGAKPGPPPKGMDKKPDAQWLEPGIMARIRHLRSEEDLRTPVCSLCWRPNQKLVQFLFTRLEQPS